MKRLLAGLTLILLIAAFAAACGDDKDSAGGQTPAATGAATATSAAPVATKASGTVIMATTTSTQDSGLLDVLVPMFEKESGWTVKTIAVGSGQAIEQASRGDADVVFVHSPAAEKKMVEAGDGIERTLVMHNDFVIVGPASDPSGVKATTSLEAAMQAIATGKAPFISRGDDSGTNALELKLWKAYNIDPSSQPWYQKSGQGMGATLQIANQKDAYTISDRGTFLAQQKNLQLTILSEGDPGLLNVYHVIVVNPEKHPNVNTAGARAWAAFVVRADVQALIGDFGKDTYGQPLFFADAGKPEPAP